MLDWDIRGSAVVGRATFTDGASAVALKVGGVPFATPGVVLAMMSPMMLVLPNGANPNLVVAADRKAFTIKNKGWSWTCTPTVVQ